VIRITILKDTAHDISWETFVWQTYKWGVEAQVDWYEAFADVLGERRKAHVLSMGSMAVTSSVRG
jgi:hypothetical protein